MWLRRLVGKINVIRSADCNGSDLHMAVHAGAKRPRKQWMHSLLFKKTPFKESNQSEMLGLPFFFLFFNDEKAWKKVWFISRVFGQCAS